MRPFGPVRLFALAATLAGALRSAFAAEPASALTVRARLAVEAPQADGSVDIRWRNDGPRPTREIRLLLFANRFRTLGANSLARHFLLGAARFVPGETEILGVESDAGKLPWKGDAANEQIVAVTLPSEVPPGASFAITVRFRTRLPSLLDTFGASDGLAVADGGWFPVPLAAGDARPAPAVTGGALEAASGLHLVVDGASVGGAVEIPPASRRLSFVVSREPFAVEQSRVGNRRVEIVTAPSAEYAHRISPNVPAAELLRDTLPIVLAASSATSDVRIVRLPLRWYPSASSADAVFVSDRLFEIFPILRALHRRELAYAVFLQEELAAASAREPAADAEWVAEGLAWRRAQALYEKRFRDGLEVDDWIGIFNVFAIVDRFETAPRIPFVRPFFPTAASDDPLRIRPDSCCVDRPPGRLVFDKLEARLRSDRMTALLDRYRKGSEPMRALLHESGGDAAVAFLDAWLRPYAPVNYALRDVELNPGGTPGARFRVERESEEARPDSVPLALERWDRSESFFVDLEPGGTRVERSTAEPIEAVQLDPKRATVETRLDDDRAPPRYQLVLDSSDVEVSSSEFGVSTLLVGRRKYDYRKDLAAAAFYTSRGYGVDLGFQLHGGQPIDANLYRQNLYAYFAYEELDSSFRNHQEPGIRHRGRVAGFGLRFNSYDAFWFENPSGSHHVRLFFDGYDPSLGSDFGFVQGGGSLTYTFPLRDDTVLAGQVLNGFSAATGSGPIPSQGLFSLGGFRSIRGIAAEDQLGKDIFMVRAELRHLLPFRLDWNFQELLIARRIQLKAFVDTGRVENSTRRLYDPGGFAVGVGGGFNLFYDFMGFFPTTFYLDVATRADEHGSPQVLFGVGQPF